MSDYPIEHRDNCTDPGNVGAFIGRLGDHVARCQSCGRIAVLDEAEPGTVPAEGPPPEPAPFKPLAASAQPDSYTRRLSTRTGKDWPSHRARARNRRRRHLAALRRERHAA